MKLKKAEEQPFVGDNYPFLHNVMGKILKLGHMRLEKMSLKLLSNETDVCKIM